MAEQPKKPLSGSNAASGGSSSPVRTSVRPAGKPSASSTNKPPSIKSSNATLEIGTRIEKDLEFLSKKKNLVAEDAIAELKRGAAREREEEERKRQKWILSILGVAIAAAALLIVLATMEKSHIERDQGRVIGPTSANGTGGIDEPKTPASGSSRPVPGGPVVLGRPGGAGAFPSMTYVQTGNGYGQRPQQYTPPVQQFPSPQPVQQRPVQNAPVQQPVQNGTAPSAQAPTVQSNPGPAPQTPVQNQGTMNVPAQQATPQAQTPNVQIQVMPGATSVTPQDTTPQSNNTQ